MYDHIEKFPLNAGLSVHAGWVRPSTPFNVSKQWILPFGIILFPMATQLDPNDKEPKPGFFLFNVAVQPGRISRPRSVKSDLAARQH